MPNYALYADLDPADQAAARALAAACGFPPGEAPHVTVLFGPANTEDGGGPADDDTSADGAFRRYPGLAAALEGRRAPFVLEPRGLGFFDRPARGLAVVKLGYDCPDLTRVREAVLAARPGLRPAGPLTPEEPLWAHVTLGIVPDAAAAAALCDAHGAAPLAGAALRVRSLSALSAVTDTPTVLWEAADD